MGGQTKLRRRMTPLPSQRAATVDPNNMSVVIVRAMTLHRDVAVQQLRGRLLRRGRQYLEMHGRRFVSSDVAVDERFSYTTKTNCPRIIHYFSAPPTPQRAKTIPGLSRWSSRIRSDQFPLLKSLVMTVTTAITNEPLFAIDARGKIAGMMRGGAI